MTEGAAPFIPPYPERVTSRLKLPELLRRMRRNLLEIWHERQFSGEVVETRILGRPILVCNSPALVQQAFIRQAACFERKTPQMRHALEPLVGDGLIISDGLVWRERRPAVAAVTHAGRIADLALVMTEVAAERAASWATLPPGRPTDMLAEMGGLAAEVICRCVFGRRLGAQAAAEVVQAFTAYQSRVTPAALLTLPDWMPRLAGLRLRPQVRAIHAVIDRLVAEAEPGSLIRAMAEGHALSPRALRNEAATLFLAGHETTASTLAWAWYLLSKAPAVAARLRAEAAALGGRPARFEDLPRLPYARAVVEETLRLYPPIPMLARVAQRAVSVGGHAVPRGGLVMAVPWLLHRHRRLWEAPDAFMPERFLEGAAPRPRHAFIPFSLGPRVCTGAHFALAEAVIVLATLAPGFAPRLAAGARVFPVARLTLRPGETLPMLIGRAA